MDFESRGFHTTRDAVNGLSRRDALLLIVIHFMHRS